MDDERNGLPHVVEHLLAATPLSDGRPLSEALERAGAQFNAVTTKEYVAVHARGPCDRLGVFNELLLEMWERCREDVWPWTEEISAVRLELEAAQASAEDQVQEHFLAELFAGHGLGQEVGGRLDSLHRLTPGHATALLESVTAGEVHLINIGDEGAQATATPEVGKPSAVVPPPPARRVSWAPPVPAGPGHGYLIVGGRGASLADPDGLAAHLVLSQLIGGTTSSIVYRRLRSELGVCYELGSWHSSYTDAGAQRVLLGLDAEHVGQACGEVITLLEDVAGGHIDESTLLSAREQARTEWLIDMEDPVLHALNCLQRIRCGTTGWAPSEVSTTIERITLDAVSRAAAGVLGSLVAVHTRV